MTATTHMPALVAKTDLSHAEQFLVLTPGGQPQWVKDPEAATSFPTMREAMRMAMRLPASQRAFGVPRSAPLAA